MLRLGDSQIGLFTRRAISYIGLTPTTGNPLELVVWCDDVDAETTPLRAAGAAVVAEPYDHIAGHRRAYVADPDGNWLALVDAPHRSNREAARARPGRARTEADGRRLAFLDNLKVLLVVGVIAVHSAVTYGFDGSWYLESYDAMARGLVDALTVLIVIGWLFGLGLFLLTRAGRAARRSTAKAAGGSHVSGWFGSGLPCSPTRCSSARDSSTSTTARMSAARPASGRSSAIRFGASPPGPTWYLEALLTFSLGYALLCTLRPAAASALTRTAAEPPRGGHRGRDRRDVVHRPPRLSDRQRAVPCSSGCSRSI